MPFYFLKLKYNQNVKYKLLNFFIKKIVAENLQKITKHSSLFFIRNRCGYTSKAGGTMDRWRLSRHVWRDIADYNVI